MSKRSPISYDSLGAIHSTKISGNFGPKLNGSVRSNRKSFEKTGPPFEVVLFSRSDRSEFWLNGSRSLTFQTDDVTSGITRYVTCTLTSGYGWFRGERVTVNTCYIKNYFFEVWQNRFLYFGVLSDN